MSALELRHQRALVALTEEGTFTDAAIRLGVTQSAVSRLIGALEDLLGLALVERTTRSVALTEAGARCYRAAVRALEAVDDVSDAARGQARPLRLGYAWSALGRHTTGVLRGWRTRHPEIPLEVHRVDDRSAGLADGTVDLAVVRGTVDLPDVTATVIFREPRVVAIATGHRLSGSASLRLTDLVEDTVLTTATGTTTLDLWPPDARPTSTLRVDNIDEWITEIAGGLAIGVTTESTSALHTHPGVRYVPLTGTELVDVHLVRPARYVHPAVPAFTDLVHEIVRRPDDERPDDQERNSAL